MTHGEVTLSSHEVEPNSRLTNPRRLIFLEYSIRSFVKAGSVFVSLGTAALDIGSERLPSRNKTLAQFTKRAKFLAGFCLMVPRSILDQHGLLDNEMELGADDLELSWRLRALGYDLAVAGDVFVHHQGAASFDTLPDDERSERIRQSDAALLRKLEAAYTPNPVPSSREIWGNDIFSEVMNDQSRA